MQKKSIDGLFFHSMTSFQAVSPDQPAYSQLRSVAGSFGLPVQTLKIMRLLSVFLFVASLAVSARPAAQTVTLSGKHLSLKQVFSAIKKQTGYVVFSEKDQLAGARPVSLSVDDIALADVLDKALTPNGLTYTIRGKTIFVTRVPVKPKPEELKSNETEEEKTALISGRVTNAKKEPLEGVSVTVKGTQTGTTTNADGRFQLSVPSANNVELVFSFVGYETRTVKAGSLTVFNIVLEETVSDLSDIVVVGYGSQIRKSVTGAMSVIKTSDLEGLTVSSATEALIGKVPGVQINQNTGVPGAAPLIKIRGVGSITAGNDPLFVIDGFPIQGFNMSNLDMNDIESISILKDAATASIYGARGGAGVILITTKKGYNGPAKVSIGSYLGFQNLSKKIDMLSPEEYVEFAKDAVNNAWAYRGNDPAEPMENRPSFYTLPSYFLDKSKWTYMDWQDEIYRTAPIMNTQVSVAGGSESVKYRVGGSFFNNQGIIKTSGFNRYNIDANIGADLNKKIKITVGIKASRINEKRIRDENQWNVGVVATALSLPQFFGAQNEDGSYPSFAGMGHNVSAVRNPMVFLNEYHDERVRNMVLGNLAIDYTILKGLKYSTHLGFENNDSRANFFQNSFINDIPEDPTYVRGTVPATGTFRGEHGFNWLWENTLGYKATWKSHDIDVIIGTTVQKDNYEQNNIAATNFPDNNVRTLNAGQVSSANTSISQWGLVSHFSRLNYGLLDKYYLSLSLRADGSSKFGAQNKWGYFPSVSAGWIISDEKFLHNSSILNFLKLRVSYGFSGNNSIPNYGSIGLLSYTNTVVGGKIVKGVIPSTLSNSLLGWESSKQVDIGLELGLFKDRIRLTTDLYQRVSNNLLLDVPVPSILGVTTALENIGKVRNRGMEFVLTTRNIVGKFSWTTDLDFSFNRNIVLQLGPSGKPIIAVTFLQSTHITQVGQPIGNYYGYVFEGIYNTQEEIDKHPHLPTDSPGDPIVKDVNKDGKITPEDRTILGNYNPDFAFGINNTLRYKKFDLSVFIQGVSGSEIMNLGMFQTASMTGRTNSLGLARDRWRSPEEPGNGKVPKAMIDVYGVRRDASTFDMFDGSYLRIRNITVGYTFGPDLLKKIKVNNIRLYLSAFNPFTFTKYIGYNPEVSQDEFDSALTPGVDYFNYPISKSFQFGFNITF